jgi:plasmid stability protein
MAANVSITIRQLDASLKRRLKGRAAAHGRSMEEEAREILKTALATDPGSGRHLVQTIRERFARAGFVDLNLPPREPMGEPVTFR